MEEIATFLKQRGVAAAAILFDKGTDIDAPVYQISSDAWASLRLLEFYRYQIAVHEEHFRSTITRATIPEMPNQRPTYFG